MIDIQKELQYLLCIQRLEQVAAAGILTTEELAVTKRLAVEKYRPKAVWE